MRIPAAGTDTTEIQPGLYGSVEGRSFVQMRLTQQPHGDWEFEVRDPNGYVLVFGGAY